MEIDKKDRLKRWKLFIETGVLTHLCKFYDLGDMCGSNGADYKILCPQKYIPGDIIQCGFQLIPGVVLRGNARPKVPDSIAQYIENEDCGSVPILTEFGWLAIDNGSGLCRDCFQQCHYNSTFEKKNFAKNTSTLPTSRHCRNCQRVRVVGAKLNFNQCI